MIHVNPIDIDLKKVENAGDWLKEFRVDDYYKNPPMIEKLNQEKLEILTQKIDLQKRLDSLEIENNQLLIKNRLCEQKNEEINKRSLHVYMLNLVSMVLLGFGVNIVTSKPYVWAGWLMLVVSIVISILSFITRPRA